MLLPNADGTLVEAEGLLRRDPHESLRLATAFLDTNTDLPLCLRARRIVARSLLHTGSYAEGETLVQESIKIARDAGERYEEAMAHHEVGVFRFVDLDYEGALGHYDAAEQLLLETGPENDIARVYLNIGTVYYNKQDIGNALMYYERTLSISERTNDDRMLATVLTNLTGIYAEFLQDEKTAIAYARRGATLFERLGDKVGLAKSYVHMGLHARLSGNYEEAISYFKKSIDLRDGNFEVNELLFTHYKVAECHLLMGNDGLSEETLRNLEALPAFKNNTGVGRQYVNGGWANLHLHREQYAEAVVLMVGMLAYFKEHNTPYLQLEITKKLAHAYAVVGNLEEAVHLYRVLVEQNAEADRLAIERRLHTMHRQFEVSQYETQAEIERLRNVELASAVERLEQLHEENAEYLAFMAHELKSPLNTIRAITQLFMEDATLAPDDRHALIVQVRSISTRMFDLINRVLERAKGRQDDDSAVIDVTLIWTYLLEQLRVRAHEKDIALNVEMPREPAFARIPEMRLISMLENLISNSIKFSQPGTTVTVSVRRLYTDGIVTSPRLLLSVKDEGQGLSSEDMDRMFRPYQRLSAAPTQGEDSTGLGLHIVRRDVERSGGRIWCESVAGQGATFYVELPLVVLA